MEATAVTICLAAQVLRGGQCDGQLSVGLSGGKMQRNWEHPAQKRGLWQGLSETGLRPASHEL